MKVMINNLNNNPVVKKKKAVLWATAYFICLFFSSCIDSEHGAADTAGRAVSVGAAKSSETTTGMLHPCHWTFTVEQEIPGEAILVSRAKIDPGWHLYSQHISEKGSPTVFAYDASPGYELMGGTEEGPSQKDHDPYLKIDIYYFEKEAVFRQKIKVMSNKDFTVTGTVNHTACQKQCVTNEDDFSFTVKGK